MSSATNLRSAILKLESLTSKKEVDDYLEELSINTQMDPAWMNEEDQQLLRRVADLKLQSIPHGK